MDPTRAAIKAEMARRGLTQGDVARHLGISQAGFSRRVRAEQDFTLGELLSIAGLLGVPASTLLPETAAA